MRLCRSTCVYVFMAGVMYSKLHQFLSFLMFLGMSHCAKDCGRKPVYAKFAQRPRWKRRRERGLQKSRCLGIICILLGAKSAVCCQHGCSDSNQGFLYLGNAASSRVAVPRTQNTAKRERVLYISLRIKAKPVKKLAFTTGRNWNLCLLTAFWISTVKALGRFYQTIMVANAPPKPYFLWGSFGGEPLDHHNKRPFGAASSSGSVQAGLPRILQRRKTKT